MIDIYNQVFTRLYDGVHAEYRRRMAVFSAHSPAFGIG